MCRSRLLPIVGVVIMASLMLASCSASSSSTELTATSSPSGSGQWWQQLFGSMCGWPAAYRIDSGAVNVTGNCAGSFSSQPAPNINLRKGEQVEIHMMYDSYSALISSEPSVLDLSGRSDGDATSTFVATSSGTAVISVRGGCAEDPNNTNGTCLVLQVAVP